MTGRRLRSSEDVSRTTQPAVLAGIGGAFAAPALPRLARASDAISEVTARCDVPLLTVTFADQVTGRGFENVFPTVAEAKIVRQT